MVSVPLMPGELDVHEDKVIRLVFGDDERLLPAAGQQDGAAERRQDPLHQRAVGGAVVDNQGGSSRQVGDFFGEGGTRPRRSGGGLAHGPWPQAGEAHGEPAAIAHLAFHRYRAAVQLH